MKITPLESWIAGRIGAGDARLSRGAIEKYQLDKLRETIAWARMRSLFYKRSLAGMSEHLLTDLGQISRFAFTCARDIRCNPLRFLCFSQDEFSRVVTLKSSGTTGDPKRIFFTDEDLDQTVDFFHCGMSTLAGPQDRVLILFPGERPGSIGDLLAQALERLSAAGIRHGIVRDASHTLRVMSECQVTCLVGIPVQVLSLARHSGGKSAPKSVLLSADHVPDSIARALRSIWGCEVYSHWGMTEMGFGGGIECGAHCGYHLREADFLFEIIDPETGEAQPDGEKGEIVFTTLTRKGMPLIRYRTGDLGRFIPEPCACGTVLKTLAPVKERIEGRVELTPGMALSMADLDEALFEIEGLIDFDAVITRCNQVDHLHVKAGVVGGGNEGVVRAIRKSLDRIPVLRDLTKEGRLTLHINAGLHEEGSGHTKRTIFDNREMLSANEYIH
ncbi:MAG: DVU_1553 family AMP-dependent CoA ligase [Syntrophobacteraceae bacterium]